MDYNFDTLHNRRGTNSVKWDTADQSFGGSGLIPMWIADMDFPAAPGILESLHRRLDERVFGYGMLSPAYYEAVIGWMKRRHGFTVEREWITFTGGVVAALHYAVQATTQPGEEVMVATPVYGPFYRAVEDNGRVLVGCPLNCKDQRYTFDFEEMERRVTPKTRVFMLCSPHNPVGRVWSRGELEQVAAFCLRHDLTIIADEIHHDLVFRRHTVFPTLSAEVAQRTILCTAPSKTFNIAGIQASNIIVPGAELRAKYLEVVQQSHGTWANSFVQAAVVGAYNNSEDWLNQLLVYLEGNMDLFCNTVAEEIPTLKVRKPEGTYLAWVDCSGLGLPPGEQGKFFVEKCGLAFNDGGSFGKEGQDFVRVNLACPRTTVEECLRRLKTHC